MKAITTVLKFIVRLLIVWLVDAISLLLTSGLVSGISISSVGDASPEVVAAAAAMVLGIVNILVRPVILMLSVPLGFLVVFAVGFLVNAVTLMITGSLIDGFTVDGFWPALLGGLILGLINTIITGVISVDDNDSFYQGVVERLAGRKKYEIDDPSRPGLLLMEVDGLSFWHLKHALDNGMLPTFKRLMQSHGYEMSHVDCGVPSQTSSCQAGIMFGDNYDIPAFRWLDKEQKKLYVSGSDAPEINARYAKGNGLLRGGASINNMMNGDAKLSLLTAADLTSGSKEERAERAREIYMLVLNPYFLMRVIVLFLWEVIVELWQYGKAVAMNVQPRLNRLHKGYPFVRAATTVLMRDVSGHLTGLEAVRGAPAIYVTWPGYDEVAHHSGPWSSDAFGVLQHYDDVVSSMMDMIERKAPRPYNLVVLSDHGQSFGATFKQRYGMDLKTYIESLMPESVKVQSTMGGDEGSMSVTAMAAELENVRSQGEGGTIGHKVIGGTKSFLEDRAGAAGESEEDLLEKALSADVTVCGSGNIAQVYFDIAPRKIAIDELNEVYPGLVDKLVEHEGIGVVVGYGDDGEPLAMGKSGVRNLNTGEIVGDDPMVMFGDPDLRAEQMRRVADFPHAGDLIINSTVYEDGTVAAMEELIGNHGGMGGEQTDAFIFHPPSLEVEPTANATDVYDLLNEYREKAPLDGAIGGPEPVTEEEVVDAWTFSTLTQGFSLDRGWIGRTLRAMVLDSGAYRDVAVDAYMTGPALLLLIVGVIIGGFTGRGAYDAWQIVVEIIAALLLVLMVHFAGRILGGKAEFTTTLRAVGFAYATRVYSLAAFVPHVGEVIKLATLLLSVVAVWLAGVEAHKLRGWRSIVFPVVVVGVFLLSLFGVQVLLRGAEFTLQGLFGL
jgi:uncharacterized membrane protein YvlD (DUF360 family)